MASYGGKLCVGGRSISCYQFCIIYCHHGAIHPYSDCAAILSRKFLGKHQVMLLPNSTSVVWHISCMIRVYVTRRVCYQHSSPLKREWKVAEVILPSDSVKYRFRFAHVQRILFHPETVQDKR